MKNILVSTTLLLSSIWTAMGCGYSPYGEDIRFSLFLPSYFKYQDFAAFNYNANLFGFDFHGANQYESNVQDWYEFTNKEVSIESVNVFLNELKLTDIHPDSKNEFIGYLYKNKKTAVLQYMTLAKKGEVINALDINDPWEREEAEIKVNRAGFLEKIIKAFHTEKNEYLKRKYAFLAIRTAYYAKDKEVIEMLFNQEFKNGKKDYLYYWSLYFDSFNNSNSGVNIATVMNHSPEKRNACYYYFHEGFNLDSALLQTQTEEEIANVYSYASIQKLDQSLAYLKEIYANNPKSRTLSFLLLREINKIEDWVYTPYYVNYSPSIEPWYNQTDRVTTNTLRDRSEKDRGYAAEMLAFLDTIDFSTVENPMLWDASEIQLLFLSKRYDDCLHKIALFENNFPTEKVKEQIEQIKALCLVSNKASISKEVQSIVLKNSTDSRFLFALGRELEFRGNLSEGMALISMADHSNSYYYDENNVEWQANRLKTSGNLAVFYNYFDYLDFVYSTEQMQQLINKLNQPIESDFEKSIYKYLLKDKNYLTDLLGTKYFRENKLTQAYSVYKSIGTKYWQENYNAWERDKYGEDYGFYENPFYDFDYTKSFIPHKERFLVTKLSVTQHLIQYTNLASNPKTIDRDYYYFLVANCYFNMTQDGNSWMMRRYSSTRSYGDNLDDSYIDEAEYYQAQLAQHYYRKAFENAKTDQFKALCLRMIDYAKSNYPNQFVQLKTAYPQYYKDLSNCENLEIYFKARR
ncbi:hypothetical protein [Flavobacterium sp.]|uniref:hypothetical protein n=1 Tax=Flavobacterium sp. TaxID=239 RepID=UPI003C486534